MALMDRFRKAKGRARGADATPDPAERSLVGPGVLRPDQLRIIERVLEIESPSSAVTPPAPPPPAPPPPPPPPAPASRGAPEPLPIWKGEWVELEPDAEPVLEPVASAPLDRSDPCPNCGEEARVSRVDLTANAGWMTCQACGLRWGGAIDRSDDDRERGEAVAG